MNVFQQFRKKTSLMAFELFTDVALKTVLEGHSELGKPFETPVPIYLLVEYEKLNESSDDEALSCFESCVEKGWVLDGVLSQSETQAKNFWALRELISEACSKYTPYKNDVSVMISKVPQFMAAVDKTLKSEYPDLDVVWFGHIGDGNLHINILKPKDLAMPDFVKRCQQVDQLLFKHIQNFGGSISAEHGVGLSKKPFLHFTRSKSEISYMKAIKSVFDPSGIMNPGKIFDL
jgi:FAD/FMN-containing dehydrogenase